jgi:DNA-binding NarL/FixJ family response regulator
VQRVLAGESLESPWITATGNQTIGDEPLLMLTPRQRETLVFLCQGYSNKEIGLRLGLAEITVKIHISSIFRALNVVNRTQAALAARRFGLHAPDSIE